MRFERRFWVPACHIKQYCITVSNLHLFLSHLKHSQDSLQVVGGLYRHAEAWKLHVDKKRCFSELTRHSSLRMKSKLSLASSRFLDQGQVLQKHVTVDFQRFASAPASTDESWDFRRIAFPTEEFCGCNSWIIFLGVAVIMEGDGPTHPI
jgi:hypothetical protein